MGWTNSHLHDRRIEGKRLGPSNPECDGPGEMLDERTFTVGAVLGEHIEAFAYEYNFGDGWDHHIVLKSA